MNFEKIATARSISDITDERNAGEQEPVHSEESNVIRGSGRVFFEPRRHRFYLLRIQPRLLEGGEFLITVNSDPLLSWPLPEKRGEDIISFFGAPRDGGERVHHGIDILAPRGTSLTAVDDVTISRIQVRERGGNTVFLRDSVRDYIYYYAHMDEWDTDIKTGDDVTTDTRLGTVGNTGNAIYSPPHLHFGIYHSSWWQPLDPWYFFIDVDDLPAERRAPQFPEENILPDTITGKDTPRLSRTYYSTTLFERSPAVRDKDGNPLTEREKPIMQQE